MNEQSVVWLSESSAFHNLLCFIYCLIMDSVLLNSCMNRYTYLIQFLFIHYNLIEFIYIHDNMGPGYVGAACCTILRSGGP